MRYLRPEQVVARASFAAERALVRARPRTLARRYARQESLALASTRDAPPLWTWPPAAFDPAARADPVRAADARHGAFTFLNQRHALGWPVDWSAPGTQRLWRFQLHGFGYAVDIVAGARPRHGADAEAFTGLVQQWLDRYGDAVGHGDPWHPFVVSERLLHWLVARALLAATPALEPAADDRLRRALLLHALYLDEHLEVDVGGNHLLKNAVALLAAGCAFEGPRPARWRGRASRVLARELPRQVLPDCGHYERSPMYHLLVLRDLLLALHVAGRRELPVVNRIADAVRRMQRFALTLRHPDGEIPLFNDAVLGEAPAPAALCGPRTQPLGPALPHSGYFLLPASTPEASGVLIADCGPPGPDDLPAHVHADALSFELSVGQRRVLVDGGMLDYEPGPARQWLRGTAAHNTVQVDGRDQSEVWATFRVGRRARVVAERWADDMLVVGRHDGYSPLGVTHRREVRAVPGSGWRVLDSLLGEGTHVADSRLRLQPRYRWRPAGNGYEAVDAAGTCPLRVLPIGAPTARLERGLYAERFNTPAEVDVLRLTRHGHLPAVFGYWLLLPGGEPVVI